MVSSRSYIDEQIERCLRLAQDVDDPLAEQRLRRLAGEYQAQADLLDISESTMDDRSGNEAA